jgi:hypothetical protein
VDANHVMLAKGFEEEMNSPLKQLAIKIKNVFNFKISKFFCTKDPFKKDFVQQKQFLQDLAFLVVKNHLPIQFVESTWLKFLIMHLCPKVAFPSRKIFSQVILVDLVEKTKQEYVLPKLKQCYFATTSFDLWMSKGTHDVFALVINFLNEKWQPQHITIRLFEANETTR